MQKKEETFSHFSLDVLIKHVLNKKKVYLQNAINRRRTVDSGFHDTLFVDCVIFRAAMQVIESRKMKW